MMRDRSHDEAMAEVFREDPVYAAGYLNYILENGDADDLVIVLRQIALAHGGLNTVANEAYQNPVQLTQPLSDKENSIFSSAIATLRMLRAMGLRLSVQPAPV